MVVDRSPFPDSIREWFLPLFWTQSDIETTNISIPMLPIAPRAKLFPGGKRKGRASLAGLLYLWLFSFILILPAQSSSETIKRILCYGDSNTAGANVPEDAKWPSVLKRNFPGSEVINAGMGGRAVSQQNGPYNALDTLDE